MPIVQVLKLRIAAIPPAWRRRLLSWTGFALTAAALAVVVYLVYRERETLLPRLLASDPTRLVPVVLLYSFDLAVGALAWASVANTFGMHVSLLRHIRIFCAANAARRLPGTLWYIGGRGALYARQNVPTRPVLLASGVELALMWVSALAVSVPSLIALLSTQPDAQQSLMQNHWLLYGAVFALVVLLNPFTLRWATKRATLPEGTAVVPLLRVYGWLLLYVTAWCLGGILLFAVISIFQPLPASAIPVVVAAWSISATASMLTFFLPSGFGVMELTLTALLASVASPALAVLAAIAMRVLVTLLDVLFGLVAYAAETREGR